MGATEARDDADAAVPLGGARLRALLAALALRAGHTTSVEALIDDVWHEHPPHDAPAALQALIGRLRRALGKDAIESAPGGYRLTADPDDIDLHRFEALVRDGQSALDRGDADTAARTLREALALWRGPALADLPDRTAAARPEAQRLEATRLRIEADLRLGRGRELVPEVRELIGTHPYDEPLHAQLIRALRDTGRGADALAAYEAMRRTLADGLGTDPGPELQALHAELLNAGMQNPGAQNAGVLNTGTHNPELPHPGSPTPN
ncbi:AfsR/SARP family transcriptional regulator, partial [Streptomyces sp. YC504]|nr:AfsR/SARP family transcriptional regulator [Streptomyces mesophilus]